MHCTSFAGLADTTVLGGARWRRWLGRRRPRGCCRRRWAYADIGCGERGQFTRSDEPWCGCGERRDFTLEAWIRTTVSPTGTSHFEGRAIVDADVVGQAGVTVSTALCLQ